MKKKKVRKMQLAKETLRYLQGASDDETTDVRTVTACVPACIATDSDVGGHCKPPV